MLTAKQFAKISTLVTMAGVLALSTSSGAWAQCGTLLDGDGVATVDPVYFECNDGNTPFEFFPLTQGTWTNVTVNWGDDQIVVKAHKDFDGKQGDAVGVQLPPENLYIFDETSGERIR